KDVFRIVPGHAIVVSPEGVRVSQYFDFDPSRELRLSSIEEYAEALGAIFKQAVRRRLRSSHPVGVQVSGGLDSSAILCQAELLKRTEASIATCHGVAMTFAKGSPADEEKYLTDIEVSHKVKIRRLRIPALHFAEKFLYCAEAPRLHWDIIFNCM